MATDPYSQHAETIESALAAKCRAERLPRDTADEFRSWARVRLLDNDQAILRKFRGQSSMRTFLVTVIQRLFLDWRNAQWGKWRPTAAARRHRLVGIELERMVIRDQCTVGEAIQTLVSRGLASESQCWSVWEELPQRPGPQLIGEEELEALPVDDVGDPLVVLEQERTVSQARAALDRAMARLDADDQVLLRLLFWEQFTIARVARHIGTEQKAMYRRVERLKRALRESLIAEGVDRDQVVAALGHPEICPSAIEPAEPRVRTDEISPSHSRAEASGG